MKKDWVRALLVDAIDRHFPITLLRKKLGLPPLLCVPLGVSDSLVLVAPYVDFSPDGFEVIRLRDVSRIAEDSRVAFHGRIMQQEGVLADIQAAPEFPLEGLPEVLQWLWDREEPVMITGKNELYLLGTIEKVGKSKLGLRYIDGEGNTDTEVTRLAYEDILSVAFGTKYVHLVAKYAEPPAVVEEKPV